MVLSVALTSSSTGARLGHADSQAPPGLSESEAPWVGPESPSKANTCRSARGTRLVPPLGFRDVVQAVHSQGAAVESGMDQARGHLDSVINT